MMYDHPTSDPVAPAATPAPPSPDANAAAALFDGKGTSHGSIGLPPPDPEAAKAEAWGAVMYDAPIKAGTSDVMRGATAELIGRGVLTEADVATAEVSILGWFREARADGLAEAAIEARVGKEAPTAKDAVKMRDETAARLRTEFGERLPAVRAEMGRWLDAHPAIRDWLGDRALDPRFAVKLADHAWRTRGSRR